MFDLSPAADQLAGLVRTVTDGDLKAPTPCPDYTVGDLLDHVNGLAVAFTMAALKTPLDGTAALRFGAMMSTFLPGADALP